MEKTLIKVNKISFGYTGGKQIISDFSYDFKEKHAYVICGENGCGKTTITKLLLGLLHPNMGSIDYMEDSMMSYVPDYNGLYKNLSVRDNVVFRLGIYKKLFKDAEEKYNEWIRKFKLENYTKTLIKDLSLGTQKKVGLLCAMLVQPDIIVLDEPTGGLDVQSQKEIIRMLTEIKDDTMIITVTHDEYYIKNFKSEIISLNRQESDDL